jgi:dienelactone hydrolase
MTTLVAVTAAAGAEPAPLVVLLGPAPEAFAAAAAARGWEIATIPEALPGDVAMRQIEAAVSEAAKRHAIDSTRVYLAGRGVATAAVFYAVSRRPDLWAAAVAAGGGAEAAIDTNRLFGANAQLVPILWAVPEAERAHVEPYRAKLAAKGFDIDFRSSQMSVAEALDWLAGHKADPYPAKIDCETGSAAFARCYWLQIAKFDAAARNDVLPPSRIAPGAGAYLGLGGFGYSLDAAGPGVVVSFLPPQYAGPLKLDDRILSVGGTHIKDARDYVAFMAGQREERALGVVVERGKERLRLESRIALGKREETLTARVRAEYMVDAHQLLLITRGVAAVRLDVPAYWTPGSINWNGNEAGSAESGGCWSVTLGGAATRCQ